MAQDLALARSLYDPRNPSAVLPHLLNAYEELGNLSGPEVHYERRDLLRAIELASGIWVDAAADRWDAVAGGTIEVTAQVLRRGDSDRRWRATHVEGVAEASMTAAADLEHNQIEARVVQVDIAEEACCFQPHWLVSLNPGPDGCEVVHDTPGPAPAIRVMFEFETPEGIGIALVKPVIDRWVDHGRPSLPT